VAEEPCIAFDTPVSRGLLEHAPLAEISGIVASRVQPGVLWAHADSGDGANLYAIDAGTAGLLAVYTLDGVTANDWEDIALAPSGEAGAFDLYIGDTGDNALARASVTVYRVREPIVPGVASGEAVVLTGAEALELTYPGAAHDCEALFVDPTDGALYLVTKDSTGVDAGLSLVYTPASVPTAASPTALVEVASIFFGTNTLQKATAADIDDAGEWITIRTYAKVFGWPRTAGNTVGASLGGVACTWRVATEFQGESLAFAPFALGYYTASERNVFGVQKLNFYDRLVAAEGEGEGMAEGEPLVPHSGDTDGSGAFELGEVLRVVQFYNAGVLSCGEGEDGYQPLEGSRECARHDADYLEPAWEITLSELLRLIQLFRLGAVSRCPETEDGFCAGP